MQRHGLYSSNPAVIDLNDLAYYVRIVADREKERRIEPGFVGYGLIRISEALLSQLGICLTAPCLVILVSWFFSNLCYFVRGGSFYELL